MKKVISALLILCYIEVQCIEQGSKILVPTYNVLPCEGSDDIKVSYESDVPQEEGYSILINRTVTKNTKIVLTFDLDSIVTLVSKHLNLFFTTCMCEWLKRNRKTVNYLTMVTCIQFMNKSN